MSLQPYDRTYWRGVVLDNFSIAFMNEVEDRLGRSIDRIYQGSYNLGVRDSAGTHDEGGALDFGDRDITAVCVACRKVDGGAAWNRTGKGDWVAHGHLIIGGNKMLSDAALRQWNDYKAGGDALGTYDGRGDYHWRPDVIREFQWGGGLAKFAEGVVYVGKLHKGQRDSDSVRRLQYRLRNHKREFANALRIDGHYGSATEGAVQFWQRNIRDADGIRDGERLNNVQANVLFGENYSVQEE